MARAKRKKRAKKAAKGKNKRKAVRTAKPKRKLAGKHKKGTAKRKKATAKRKKTTPKRNVAAKAKKAKAKKKVAAAKKGVKKVAAAGMTKLKSELKRLQQLQSQLHEQIRAKDSTINMQMQEIMELKKALEDLRPGPLQWRP